MWFYRRLKKEEACWTRCARSDFNAFRRYEARHLIRARHHIAQKFQCPTYAHVLSGTYAEDREHASRDKPCANTRAHIILRKRSFFKEFLHQGVVVLCRGFDENFMQFCSLFRFLGRNLQYFRYASFRLPTIHFHLQHIDHRIKCSSTLYRILYLNSFCSIVFFQLCDRIIKVRLVIIQLIDHKNHRLMKFFRITELVDRTYLYPVLCIDDHQGCICHVQS